MEGAFPYKNQTAYGMPAMEKTSVVSDYFCNPYPVELIVKKKIKGLTGALIEVVDVQSNLLLRVDGPSSTFQMKRILRDPSGYPILTMREKVMTLHHRWTVHRGEGSDPKDLMFTVQRSHPLQFKTRLQVFLPSNHSRDVGNFHVIGKYDDGSARIYRGDTLIAEVMDKSSFGRFFEGKEDFAVKVYPFVDYAFIISLLVIYNETDNII